MKIFFQKQRYCSFGKTLVDVAIYNDMSKQLHLVKALRSSPTHIHGILMGKIKPSVKFMESLKKGLSVNPADWDRLHNEALSVNGWGGLK